MLNMLQACEKSAAYRQLEPVAGIRLEKIHFFADPGRSLHEVLSQLHHAYDAETFFRQLSTRARETLFLEQMSMVLTQQGHFTLNLSLSLLLTPTFIEKLLARGHQQRIILEIQDPQSLLPLDEQQQEHAFSAIRALHTAGYRVWLDDLLPLHFVCWQRAGIRFDAVKIDHQLFRQLSDTPARLAMLVARYRYLGEQIVIEGVETPQDFTLCQQSGACAVQGFLFDSSTFPFELYQG